MLYSGWHPPVTSWLIGLGDAIVPGTGLFVLLNTLLLSGSMLGLLALQPKPSWRAAAFALFCVLLPQFLLFPGIVWKDVLFANAALAGFVCLAQAAANWKWLALRIALIVAALVLLVLAALVRQNGMLALFAGALGLGAIAAASAPRSRARYALAYGIGGLGLALILACATNAALARRVKGAGVQQQIRLLQDYDLIAMVKSDSAIKLELLRKDAPALERAIRSDGARLYSAQRNDTLMQSQPLQDALAATSSALVTRQWLSAIIEHPLLYLSVRADEFGWLLFTPDIEACHPYFVGVDGPAEKMAALGLAKRLDARDILLDGYAGAFAQTPLFSHLPFVLIGAIALFLLLRRRRPADIAIVFLLIGAALFTLSFFVISIACDYRYLYFLDISALASGFYVSLDIPGPEPDASG